MTIVPLTSAQQAPTGSGLSISPTISEFTIKPGESNIVKITLKNVTVDSVVAQGVINDFTSDGVTGNPKIITDPNFVSPNSIKRFIGTLDNVPLKVGEQKNITVPVNVPSDIAPGAYYGIIRYKAVPTGTAAPAPGQVALTASVGTIVLVTVPGNIRQQVQLTAVHVYRGSRESSLFFTRPNKVGVEIKNFGNGFVAPFGTVEIQNTFGKAVETLQFNNPKQLGNILPSSNRIFLNGINGIKQPGRYKVTANVAYGAGSQVLTLSKTIWYVPVWLAIAIAAVVLILAFLVYRTYRHYKQDKRHSYRGR
jgi:hypothetical protein